MTQPVPGPASRRTFLVSAFAGLAASTSGPTQARSRDSWDGTWVGKQGQSVLQVIVAGGEAVGLFWNNDYPTVRRSSVEGSALTVTWAGGGVTLSRGPGRTATATISSAGRAPVVISVARE